MKKELLSFIDPSPESTLTGPLEGRTVVLQPNLSVRGWPCEAGSVALERYVPLETATIVERLRAAGAKIIGSAHMAELGFGLAGDTTARALAEGLGDIAVVTDTMGEARHTACSARAFGFKPSYGLVSRFGLIGLVPSMEGSGIVAKSPADVAAVMAAWMGPDEHDPSMLQETGPDFTKISDHQDHISVAGVIRECVGSLQDVEAKVFEAALSKLETAGTRIEEVSLPDFDLFRTVHNVVGSTEASSSAGKYDSVRYGHRTADADNWNEMYLQSRAESFGPVVKSYLFQGAYFQFQNYPAFENACRIRRRLVEKMKALLEEVDVLVCPTQRIREDEAAESTIRDVYDKFELTLPANVTGQPALSVPGLVTYDGRDFGLQVVGAPLADVALLSFAVRLARLDDDRGEA